MRRTGCLVLAVGIAGGAALLAGCNSPSLVRWNYPHANTVTLGETRDEHCHRVYQISDHERRALHEDLDLLFLTERKTRLTRWHVR